MGNKRNRPLRQHMPRKSRKTAKYRRSAYGTSPRRKRRGLVSAFWIVLLVCLLAIGGFFGYKYYTIHMQPATLANKVTYLYIRKGDAESKVVAQLTERAGLRHPRIFAQYASSRSLGSHLRPGRYGIAPGMTVEDIVDKLASGEQSPVRINISSVRTRADLLAVLSKNLEAKTDALAAILSDSSVCRKYGDFDPESIRCLFMPGVYELNWDVSPIGLLDTMKLYYDRYWTTERRAKADSLGLSPIQVAIVASIVQQESKKEDEYADIAGLYINRQRKGMLLQADPTVKFANDSFDLRRITADHLRAESPYNTYKHKGLPPGPICLARPATIDRVLSASKHPYLYMCAREDFSGYHTFASTYAEHLVNARRYQAQLDKHNIR